MLSSVSFGVPYSDAVPRLIDVALFLCENALHLLCETKRRRPACADELYRWFLVKIAHIHAHDGDDEAERRRSTTISVDPGSRTEGGQLGGSEVGFGNSRYMPEVDLSSAYRELHSNVCEPRRPRQLCPTGVTKRDCTALDPTTRDANDDDDAGMRVLRDFLRLCLSLGGNDLVRNAARLLARPLSFQPDLGVLCTLFAMPDDIQLASFLAIGSATRSFHVWVCLAWACASFRRQSVIADATARWAHELQHYAGGTTHPHASGPRHGDMSPSPCASDHPTCRSEVNLSQLTDILRAVFEGRANSTETLIELLFAHPAPASLAEGYLAKLLLVQGPPTAATVARSELTNRGTRPILLHITCGMLLYVQYHLTVHDLEAAQRCANMATLVGHQLHSNTLLALAHHSAFLVRLAAGAPREAADSISVALQISADLSLRLQRRGDAATTTCTDVEVQAGGLHTGSLCYLGAAQLLVFFPGTVDSTLRSSLIAMAAATTTRGRGEATGGGDAEDASRTDAGRPVSTTLPAGPLVWQSGASSDAPRRWSGAGNAVVVQSIAQTVQHALCLAEFEAVLNQPAGCAWVVPVTALARETVRLVAGHLYGFAATGIALHAESVGQLWRQLNAEVAVTAPWPAAASPRPAYALLAEMTRHAAYQALVCQERGALSTAGRDDVCGPFAILRDFVLAIEQYYGADGVSFVSTHSFFDGVRDYLLACWLHTRGFVAAAYDAATDIVVNLCAVAGADIGGDRAETDHGPGHATCECAALRDACRSRPVSLAEAGAPPRISPGGCASDVADEALARALCEGETKGLYWPPDHLLLLSYAQLLRAETACYLGYTNKLAFMCMTLNALCARHHFVFGILVSRLMESMSMQLRSCPSARLEALRDVRSAAQQVGLRSIECRAQIQCVTAHAGGGEWCEGLMALDSINPLPLSLRTWYLLQRFNFALELLLNDVRCPEEGLVEFVTSGVALLRESGHLCDSAQTANALLSHADRDSASVSVQCLLCLHASVARALKLVLLACTDKEPERVDESYCSSVLECVDVFARALRRRQRVTSCVKGLRNYTVLQLCDLVLTGHLAPFLESSETQRDG